MDPVKGEGTIDVGWPDVIHSSKLKHMVPSVTMNRSDLEALMAEIRELSVCLTQGQN